MMAGDNEQKSQEKYMELQFLQQQMEQIQKYQEEIEAKQQEFTQTREALGELEKADNTTEFFAPLSQGIFTKATLASKNILVNVGANVAVEKSIPQARDLIDRQLTEVGEIQQQLETNTNALTEQMNMIIEELQKLS